MIRRYSLASAGLTIVTTAYTSGDMLGTEMTLTLSDRGNGPVGGKIVGVTCTDDSDVIGALDLFFFEAASTPAADNAANSWADANLQTLSCAVSLTTPLYDSGLNKAVTAPMAEMGVPFYAPTGVLYVNAITRTGNAVFAAGATSLNYKIFVEI